MPTSDVLTFDAARHEYRVGGRVVPSVTQILQATGVSVDFETIRGMSRTLGDAVDLKRAIGSAVHEDAHAFDDGDIDWSTVDDRVLPYLQAWVAFRANYKSLTPAARERRVYHASLGYCGTLDGVFTRPSGARVLIDIKTGDPASSGCRYQTAAYALAWMLEHPDAPIGERWAVQLTPEHRVPYRVEPYTDWADLETWRAIVTTYYAQHARRRDAHVAA